MSTRFSFCYAPTHDAAPRVVRIADAIDATSFWRTALWPISTSRNISANLHPCIFTHAGSIFRMASITFLCCLPVTSAISSEVICFSVFKPLRVAVLQLKIRVVWEWKIISIFIYINIEVFLRYEVDEKQLQRCNVQQRERLPHRCHVKHSPSVISSVVERSLHALRLVEMTLGRGRPRLVEMTGRSGNFFSKNIREPQWKYRTFASSKWMRKGAPARGKTISHVH